MTTTTNHDFETTLSNIEKPVSKHGSLSLSITRDSNITYASHQKRPPLTKPITVNGSRSIKKEKGHSSFAVDTHNDGLLTKKNLDLTSNHEDTTTSGNSSRKPISIRQNAYTRRLGGGRTSDAQQTSSSQHIRQSQTSQTSQQFLSLNTALQDQVKSSI